MRNISTAFDTALQKGVLKPRDFIWMVVRDRTTGNPVTDGTWSDIGTGSFPVVNPDDGSTVYRTFVGSGTLIDVGDINIVSSLTVQTVTIKMSHLIDHVNDLIRTYDCKQGIIQIFRGLLNIETNELAAPAEIRFNGFIDEIEIETPSENNEGFIKVTAKSNTQEMSKYSTETRSHNSQVQRLATDEFYMDTAVVSEWEHFWGKSSGKVDTQRRLARVGGNGAIG